ncbi:hypothetical protein GCM10029978_113150 [Actinoallomurus acanthiterrae]
MFTIVASSTTINWARPITASANQRCFACGCAWPDGLVKAASTWVDDMDFPPHWARMAQWCVAIDVIRNGFVP